MKPRVVLVTGAFRGLGPEIARQLAGDEHVVVVGTRDPADGSAVARERGDHAWPVTLDVTDPKSVQAGAVPSGSFLQDGEHVPW